MSRSKRQRLDVKTPATYGQDTAAYESPRSSAEHLTDKLGFTTLKHSKFTYGAKNTNSRGQPEKKATTSKPKLCVPDRIDSPEKSEASKLIVPSGSVPSSRPISPPGELVLKDHRDDAVLENTLPSPEAKSILETTGFKAKGTRVNPPIRQTKKEIEVPKAPSPPPAVFKLPARISELARRTGDVRDQPGGELCSILSDAESDGRQSDVEAIDAGEEHATVMAVCPWCGEPVDKALLDESSKGKRMNVRQQTRFCRKHRKQTAVEMWQANGYPKVDWQVLDERFAEHHTLLLDIVNGKSSHFRSILGEKIQSGQARSMKKEDNLNPGYYGPRGFNLMCDYLVNEFGDLLKEKAVDDRVIAGRGSAAFIQSVLVAELAVQLIKDDMGVSVADARDIMEESKSLGEMVHEEV
ncbi:Uncharacterized protein TCAP_03177 [Tolypocladium capitatum]|uniref:Restriction of telomere capping protein 4 n=1 Tax=Tolypocladium capitatum TaxID=45235 RepID=A0A2K3QH85_9HYPO|nr:Uncharacterized protein TCAP_03177 [Tolypocladium capitatum]